MRDDFKKRWTSIAVKKMRMTSAIRLSLIHSVSHLIPTAANRLRSAKRMSSVDASLTGNDPSGKRKKKPKNVACDWLDGIFIFFVYFLHTPKSRVSINIYV